MLFDCLKGIHGRCSSLATTAAATTATAATTAAATAAAAVAAAAARADDMEPRLCAPRELSMLVRCPDPPPKAPCDE
jgi:hypothetical protein